jgi:hypothetical protein
VGFELQDPPRPAPPPQKPGLGMDWLARIFAWLISAVLITFIYLTEFHPSYLIDLIRAWRG